MSFLKSLREWGREHLRKSDPGAVLYNLHIKKELSPADIALKFKVPSRAVRFWFDAYTVQTSVFEPRIIRAAKEKKFKSLADYFRARWQVGFQKMSDELGVSRSTVQEYYAVFEEELESTKESVYGK
jgi:hypothetical protein